MDATVAAGWIGAGAGLVGAVVGAGGAIVGGWFQHRQQTRTDRQKQIDERGHDAGNKALTEMFALRRHILLWGPGLDPGSRASWLRTGREMADQAEIAAKLIPQAGEVRTRMEEALTVVVTQMHWEHEEPEHPSYHSKVALEHAIDIVAAFMCREPLPEPTNAVERLREERALYALENPPDLG